MNVLPGATAHLESIDLERRFFSFVNYADQATTRIGSARIPIPPLVEVLPADLFDSMADNPSIRCSRNLVRDLINTLNVPWILNRYVRPPRLADCGTTNDNI
jgi:hypothetical protein